MSDELADEKLEEIIENIDYEKYTKPSAEDESIPRTVEPDVTNEVCLDVSTTQRVIVALLRAKRKTKHHDLELTEEINTLQRRLEEEAGVTGVELAPEYDQ